MRPPRTTDARPGTPPSPARGRRAHAGPPADESIGHDGPPSAAGTSVPHGRRTLRPRTVRAKIISLLTVPVVSLLALWGFATVSTAQDVAGLRQLQRVDEEVRAPVAAAIAALQNERGAAVLRAADPSRAHTGALEKQVGRTDRTLAALRLDGGHTLADTGSLPGGVAGRLDRFLGLAEHLRAGAEKDGGSNGAAVYERYTETLTAAFAVSGALTGIQDGSLGSDARVLFELARADEMLAREDALLTAAGRTGTLKGRPLQLFTGAVATRRSLTETAGADLPAAERAAWSDFTARPAYRSVQAAEDRVLAAAPGQAAARAVPAGDWQRAAAGVRSELGSIGAGAGERAADRADPLARGLLSPSGAAVIFGCAAVAASLVISVRIGRGLVTELVSLRNGALEIARRKLPLAMQRLRAGEELDIGAEAPPGPVWHDEIGQVGEALGTVHRAALEAAVERAELADGISGVFVNLARRSQVLVHRQLNLLDSMERRADDPDELSDLFRLDHLTTRMRRHAESLIILSGAAPGRAWRMPVSLTDVVRAAVSEVEDYTRVEVRRLPDGAVKGTAVADLTHLLAELVENAAQFSPPHTKVHITGEPVGNGYALEIEDRGLGMGPELLGEANRRMEQAEALDLFDSDRLGLFVVGRLAARHRIKVRLRTSPYGGTTAVVLLPTAVLQDALPTAGAQGAPRSASADRRDAQEGTPFGAASGPRPARAGTTAFPVPVTVPALESSAGPEAGVTELRQRPRKADVRGDDEALPRRVRQASLVPQLREVPRPGPPATAGRAEDISAGRTPEQVRDRMTAYRAGWVRGSGSSRTVPDTSAPRQDTDPCPPTEGDPA
ncbi:nitrate- and nitrite sensing domain-containing protein [Streptomyces sp. NPDC058221]|uniref:sensor histidine kinase n=1 Tax=Streptomyces sp. NPDC058221 TaxID=3346388 RepID=UPI0036E0D0E0